MTMMMTLMKSDNDDLVLIKHPRKFSNTSFELESCAGHLIELWRWVWSWSIVGNHHCDDYYFGGNRRINWLLCWIVVDIVRVVWTIWWHWCCSGCPVLRFENWVTMMLWASFFCVEVVIGVGVCVMFFSLLVCFLCFDWWRRKRDFRTRRTEDRWDDKLVATWTFRGKIDLKCQVVVDHLHETIDTQWCIMHCLGPPSIHFLMSRNCRRENPASVTPSEEIFWERRLSPQENRQTKTDDEGDPKKHSQ